MMSALFFCSNGLSAVVQENKDRIKGDVKRMNLNFITFILKTDE
jgi:hypothetical protein